MKKRRKPEALFLPTHWLFRLFKPLTYRIISIGFFPLSDCSRLVGTSNIDLSGNNNIIGEDPLFVGDGDYSLQEESPAIDAGNNTFLPAEITKDLAGNPRISNGIVDLGAFEFQQEIPVAINTVSAEKERTIIGFYSILGKKLTKEPESGLYIILYNDGSAEKIVRY